MKIYTGRGDEGMTDLRDMTRVSKTSHRIEAYGTVDEVNALIGTVRPTGHDDVDDVLEAVQNHLHIVQADLANPDPDEGDPQIAADHVDELEAWIDEADEELDPLTSFILPGGSETGAKLHHARAVSRRPSAAPSRSRPKNPSTRKSSRTSTASPTRCSSSRDWSTSATGYPRSHRRTESERPPHRPVSARSLARIMGPGRTNRAHGIAVPEGARR